MQMYKCDRCGKLIPAEERSLAHIESCMSDLCPECYTEFLRDHTRITNFYTNSLDAVKVKYGMMSISNIIKKGTEKK